MDTTTGITSLTPLPTNIRNGMVAMGLFGVLSTISCVSLILFITYRMVYWRKYYDHSIARNQIFILIYNLLLADFQQAMSFLIAFHWIAEDELVGPNSACFAQGWLIQIGDVSSGLWVLAIAVHTFISLVAQRQIPMPIFVLAVVFIWLFCLLLTAIGPITSRDNFFVPSGAWCWINQDHQNERLYLHYLWIFISQLGSLVIYFYIFFHLRMRLASSQIFHQDNSGSSSTDHNNQNSFDKPVARSGTVTTIVSKPNRDVFAMSRQRILRTARYMVVYPIAYVTLTLPLAAGRVAAMAGHTPPATYFPVAGTLMASCGFVDVLLYIYTRKALIRSSVAFRGTDNNRFTQRPLQNNDHNNIMMSPMNNDTEEMNLESRKGSLGKIVVLNTVTTETTTTSEETLGQVGGLDGVSERNGSQSSLVDRDWRGGRKGGKIWSGST